MLEYIKEYVKDNFKSIIVLLSCIIIGIVVGIFVFCFMNDGTKNELIKTLNETLSYTKNENFQGINVIKNGMISNFILVIILYFAAITLIAPGLVCIINAFKGFAIGLYIPTLFQVFGFGNGILVLLLLVIIPNIVYIPAFIYLSINSLNFHSHITMLTGSGNKIGVIIKEIYKLILGFSIISLSVIVEQFLSIAVIHIYMNM